MSERKPTSFVNFQDSIVGARQTGACVAIEMTHPWDPASHCVVLNLDEALRFKALIDAAINDVIANHYAPERDQQAAARRAKKGPR